MNQNRKVAPEANEYNRTFEILCALKSKSFIYRGEQIEVFEISEEDQTRFAVLTSIGTIHVPVQKAATFIKECYAIAQVKPAAASVLPQVVAPANRSEGMLEEMSEDLFEIFKSLKNAPTKENIEKATALSNTANTISNMMKLRLQASKIGNKLK